MKKDIVSKFCEETKKALLKDLYGILLDKNSAYEGFCFWVVPYAMKPIHENKLSHIKGKLEKKYRKKLTLVYISPDQFFNALSKMAYEVGTTIIKKQVKVCYTTRDFRQKFLQYISNPTETPSVKIEKYMI